MTQKCFSILILFGFLFLLISTSCKRSSGEGDGDVDGDSDGDVDGDSDGDVDGDSDSDADQDADEEDPPDPRWEAFLEQRQGYLESLAQPIENCVVQNDTENAVFHGCYDWHSACHGVYALLVLARLTTDETYLNLANSLLTAENIGQEVAALESGSFPAYNNPSGYDELPYGYAWFFALQRERNGSGQDDLDEMAELMATGLYEYLTNPYLADVADICENQHDNLSWAVFNLWHYEMLHGRTERLEWLEEFTRNEIIAQESVCPLAEANDNRSQFFPMALLRAMTIVTVLPEAERDAWIAENVPPDFTMTPITRDELEGSGAHLAGLNFARAWGLYRLYRATGERRFRDLYMDHIEANMAMPEFWDLSSSYMNSHWIAQFGVYGIALSYDE